MAPLKNDDTTACAKARLLMVGFAVFLLLLTWSCGKPQQKGASPGRAPRMLITQRTESGIGHASINSADAVTAAAAGMEIVAFVSPTQTKEPILAEINGDLGPTGPLGKPYIRVWYNDSHGGGDEFGIFEGPRIPKSNPNPNLKADDHIAPSEIHLPAGHPGYLLVFFNSCKSADGAAQWKSALGGSLGAPEYLCWTVDTPGLAGLVAEGFGVGIAEYFRDMESENPPTKSIGVYVYEKIIEYCRSKLPYDPEEILKTQLKLIK